MARMQVVAQLRGEQPLPWAEGRLSPELRARLGSFYGPILQLLERDPALRPSAAQLIDACMAIASSSTTLNLGPVAGASALDGSMLLA